MTFNFWRKQNEDEHAFSLIESAQLDARLEASYDEALNAAIKNLDDPQPSLAWRSQLNARLASEVKRKKTKSVWMRTAYAGATAFVLFAAFALRPEPNDPVKSSQSVALANDVSIEEAILSDHQDSAAQTSLGIYVSHEGPYGY